MTAPDPGYAEEDPAGAPASGPEVPSSGPDNNGTDGTSKPEPERDHGDNADDQQTAQVINNFYAEVAANTVGVSGSAGQPSRPAIRRESGVLAVAQAEEALRYYLRPTPFSQALKILTERHLIALTGPEGCGKKAGTLQLARLVCPDAESFTILPPTRSLPELAAYKGYRPGQAFLLHDWVPVSTDLKSVAAYDLEQLVGRLVKMNAYMAITFESLSHFQALLDELCVPWSAPEPAALLEHCADKIPDLKLSDSERQELLARADELRSPRLIIKLAESAVDSVATALAEAGETENSAVAAWFNASPERWKVWAIAALLFLSGIRERKFERLLAELRETATGAHSPDDEPRDEPKDEDPFPQTRWRLANDASLGTFISDRDPAAPVGSEHRPAFRTMAYRLHFMTELNIRCGDDLWTPVRDWLFALADQPFGEAQIAAGYGLALLARCALAEVEDTYLTRWSAGNLKERLMAVNVLWSMAEDDLCAPAALRVTVSWVRNRGQERAITAALTFGGPLGERYPSEAMRWLWVLTQRGTRVSLVASTAMSQLFAMEAEADLEKSTVARFVLRKIRPMLRPYDHRGAPTRDVTVRERHAALSVASSVLSTTQILSDTPAVASVLRTRPADFEPLGELWAAVLNSVPHRAQAIRALHRTLAALTKDANSEEIAARLGAVILPRLTPRSLQVLKLALPNPERAEELSAAVIAAFLGTRRKEKRGIP
jgi:hypothetical protein